MICPHKLLINNSQTHLVRTYV